MENIVIVGASGFGKEIKWIIDRENQIKTRWEFLGFIDKEYENEEVIGDDNFIINYPQELNVVIAIANPDIRRRLVHKYKSNGNIKFPNLIDPSVIMSESIKMGEGNIICANNILTIDVTIGDFNIINLRCTIGHEVNINNFVTVNPGVNISGNVCLDDGTNIGTGAKIIQGKSIGEDSVIGAGAVVIKSIEPNSTAVGVPAKVIKGNR